MLLPYPGELVVRYPTAVLARKVPAMLEMRMPPQGLVVVVSQVAMVEVHWRMLPFA